MKPGREQRSGPGFKTLSRLMSDLSDEMGWESRREFGRLCAEWEAVTGGDAARNSRPFKIEGSTLRIAVPDAAWSQNLVLFTSHIIAELKDKYPLLGITKLAFFIKPDSFAKPASEPSNRSGGNRKGNDPGPQGPYPPLPEDLERGLGTLSDHELRDAARKVMSITRRKKK